MKQDIGISDRKGLVFNIQRLSFQDGPGIRTTVFLKGCPLSCSWCSNPESQSDMPELGLIRSRCNKCGRCVDACPEGAISLDDSGVLVLDRKHCTVCGECAQVCSPKALSVYGKQLTVREVLEVVLRDKIFYEGSGGGVTVSGGEPLQQPSFVRNLFWFCRQQGIATCLDTCGYASSEVVESVLPFTDIVLFDIKHMDPRVHRDLTGRANDLVLANAELVAKSGVSMVCRMPLVPGVNDDLENLRETARFVKGLDGNVTGIDILPYHRLGLGKYEALDKPYSLKEVKPPEPGHLAWAKGVLQEVGVRSHIEV